MILFVTFFYSTRAPKLYNHRISFANIGPNITLLQCVEWQIAISDETEAFNLLKKKIKLKNYKMPLLLISLRMIALLGTI